MFLFFQFIGKEGEIDLAVSAVLPEVWMLLETVLARMLEDKDAIVGQQVGLEHHIRQRSQTVDGVWRVGEGDVETAAGALKHVEHIGTYNMYVVQAELSAAMLDEIGALGVDVDRRHATCSTRNKLKRYRPGTCKKVDNYTFAKVDIIAKYVEQALASHVGSRPDWQVRRRVETAPTQCTGNYSHISNSAWR